MLLAAELVLLAGPSLAKRTRLLCRCVDLTRRSVREGAQRGEDTSGRVQMPTSTRLGLGALRPLPFPGVPVLALAPAGHRHPISAEE